MSKNKLQQENIKDLCEMAFDPKITYREIGWKYNITKERVRQLLNQYAPYIVEKRKALKKGPCIVCEKHFLPAHLHSFRKQLYCKECYSKLVGSRKDKWSFDYDDCIVCHSTSKKNHTKGVCTGCYSKWAYHNVPGKREKVLAHNIRWQKRNPDKVRITTKKAVRNYLNRLKADPKRWEEYKQKSKEAYHKNMKDSVWREKMRLYYRTKWLIRKNPTLKGHGKEIIEEYFNKKNNETL